jgi:cytochrome c biogenesis protein CcmG/thiol:disulfide interchange protein DsbE
MLRLSFPLAFALAAAVATPVRAREVGERIPADEVLGVGLDGAAITAGSLAGKPALIVFWATWCRNCARELPTAEALHKRWAGRAAVLGVSTDRSARDVRRFLRKNGGRLTFAVSQDPKGATSRAFGVRELPTNVLIDATGIVRWRRVGFDGEWLKELGAVLRALPRAEGAGT